MSEKNPLILVPGLLCTEDLWRDQIQALSDLADITVADHSLDDTISAIADRVLETAPPVFDLAGLSMGGYVALEILFRAPERVSRLALMDTRADADSPADKKKRQDFINLVQRGKAFKGVTESLLPILIHPSRFEDKALVNRIYDMAQDIGRDAFIRQEMAIMTRTDYWDRLPEIQCPTLVVSGAEDALIPAAHQKKMADAIPDAEFHSIADCGHLPTMEKPFETNRLMREWLDW
ncbi:alpha/beta fold hydrolase [Sneathiella chinensis]|uniref:Hydrolase n=1 Tax=Sneathiella chinensis TaxID=349750 RepID=A0ABQ5U4Q1_9PROT|nr:alpha/beta fold hydrolase [Sneathiella chinensis]GLQ07140.1 hydrolase [Sneathiella chinensis]